MWFSSTSLWSHIRSDLCILFTNAQTRAENKDEICSSSPARQPTAMLQMCCILSTSKITLCRIVLVLAKDITAGHCSLYKPYLQVSYGSAKCFPLFDIGSCLLKHPFAVTQGHDGNHQSLLWQLLHHGVEPRVGFPQRRLLRKANVLKE